MAFFYLSLVDWLILLIGILVLFYFYSTWTYDHFKKHNINYVKPVPFFGNFIEIIKKSKPAVDLLQDLYYSFPEDGFVGVFEFRKPCVMLRDPDMIKTVAIKDFDSFLDHRLIIDENVDPLWGRNLFSLKGQKWRDMRVTLSPAFTGSKMRGMYSLTNECAELVINYINGEIKKGTSIFDVKDICSRFATDVIATSAFGVKTDSLTDKENEFYQMGKRVSNFSTLQLMKFLAYSSFPDVMKTLKINIFDKATSDFSRNLIKSTIATREQHNIHRPDMIHLLMQARKGLLKAEKEEQAESYATVQEHLAADQKNIQKKEITDDDITAQGLLFFLAGFDSASNLMCFTLHELTVNEDIQQKLVAEIKDANKENKIITYEVIQKLKYLDMVVSESLRKWPPTPAGDRICTKPYTLDDGKNQIKMVPGDVVFLPIYGLHHDPKYFPNPDKFDPERFNDENKHNIKTGTYIPFGAGPRNCIGSRFALMEAKAIIFHILTNFELRVCEKTQIPLRLSKKSFTLLAEKGFWIEFKPRAEE